MVLIEHFFAKSSILYLSVFNNFSLNWNSLKNEKKKELISLY